MREAAARFAALAQENLSDEALAGVFTEAVREAGAWVRFRFVEYLVPNALRGGRLDVLLRLARVKATQFDLLGDLDYATMIIDRRLHALADSAPERVRELLCTQEIDTEAVREAAPTWWRAVEDFLAGYGARTTRMYQPFSSTAWREDLPGFLRVVAMMDHADGRPPAARSTHEQLVTKTVLRLPRFLRRRFLRLVDDYRAGHVMREASVVDTEEFCAALRALALEAGRRMSQAGLIPAPGDVKFLTQEELLGWLRGSAVDVAGIVARRRWARPLAEAAWHEGRESEDGGHGVRSGSEPRTGHRPRTDHHRPRRLPTPAGRRRPGVPGHRSRLDAAVRARRRGGRRDGRPALARRYRRPGVRHPRGTGHSRSDQHPRRRPAGHRRRHPGSSNSPKQRISQLAETRRRSGQGASRPSGTTPTPSDLR